MPASAATKNTPLSTASAAKRGEVTKPNSPRAPISPSTATTNSNPVPNAESSTSPSPPSKKDFDNKKRTIKIPSVFIAIFATPLHFFHPTKSPVILSHPIFLITPYIFISLGFNHQSVCPTQNNRLTRRQPVRIKAAAPSAIGKVTEWHRQSSPMQNTASPRRTQTPNRHPAM